VETKSPWLPSVFVKRLEPGESVERPLTNDGEVADQSGFVASYEGDRAIQVDLVHPSPDGKGNSRPAIKISRSRESTASGLARGTLILRTPESGEAFAKIDIAVFLPR